MNQTHRSSRPGELLGVESHVGEHTTRTRRERSSMSMRLPTSLQSRCISRFVEKVLTDQILMTYGSKAENQGDWSPHAKASFAASTPISQLPRGPEIWA